MTDEENLVEELLTPPPIHDMVPISELDIPQNLEDNSFYIVKYKELSYKELAVLEELEAKHEKLHGMRYKYYRFEDNEAWTKPEIEKYCLPSDPKVVQTKGIIAKQKARVRFFEICYKGFEQAGWRMKSFIDVMRSGI